jgi:phosphatidylinositol-3-phosphatase
VGDLTGADEFLRAWMPLILGSPAYKHGDMLVVLTFDESEASGTACSAACCDEQPSPNTHAPGDAGVTTDDGPGGGRVGALLLNSKYMEPGSTRRDRLYKHYSALRSYEDLLGFTTGGVDGEYHLGFAAAKGLAPFGTDVFPLQLSGSAKKK